ncbi:elongator complex protein 4-like [Oppia nitens]|uniref:elongator complex protein 4-like n=1 Tax=Oppia nitens TaxID=1686743 RepID=UPI0023DC66EC|nr:elongator complex protein 4-like [Oppia nitens]
MAVRFDRNMTAVESIVGTHMSSKGMQLMTSTGIPSLDHLFGGGLAINSITLLEDDQMSQFGPLFAKCFVAQSVDCNHKTIICSQTITSIKSRFLRELPINSSEPQKLITSDNDLKIAWRYKSQSLATNTSIRDVQNFDFSSHISDDRLSSADITFCSHDSLLDVIRALNGQKDSKTVTRILIDGLASPLSPLDVENLPKFIYQLKCLVRQLANIVCLITFNPHLVVVSNHSYIRNRVHNLTDCVIQLVAFDEWTQTPYTEFDGLFNIIKLSKLNSFNYYMTPETLDLGFQLKNHKRYLVVDKLSLPPDLSETASRTTGCSTGATSNSKLDF